MVSYSIDKRFTGIFKEELLRDKMISLCSKSYIIEDKQGKEKISCKGISKKVFFPKKDPMSKFENTLHNCTINSATKIGFRVKQNNIFTYSQEKNRIYLFLLQKKSIRGWDKYRTIKYWIMPLVKSCWINRKGPGSIV